MRRRDVIALVGGAAAWPLVTEAQQSPAKLRVGVVATYPRTTSVWTAFERRLSQLGYQDGRNFVFDYVQVPNAGAMEAGFRELMVRKPDVIVTGGPEFSLKAAIKASQTTPIVMLAIDFDPIKLGYVAGLARPGGRITGISAQPIDVTEKRLQFFKEAFPDMSAAAVFWDSISADQWQAAQRAGNSQRVQLAGVDLGEPPFDYEGELAQLPSDYRKYLFVLLSPRFFADRKRQAEVALSQRMASMFAYREAVDAGGLLSYGPSLDAMFGKAADYVDRIARGALPSELPIEQPSKFELVINLATAKKLGLDLSPTFLARADEVIE